ncbi:PadR family transcriptional regulator [Catenulispora sp. NF23]|uniref:PadR family transcriptional regulator n=1 Tax=Catenulispora pinistramenti TaxID=2705254 RepID=UPI001BA92408|nr:PadR family transcriptional regulator [Catenulispora pinistramenti]MBS2532233.1 PadR family transcriptional regulator [Catenulispora pinistramenti]
MAAAQTPAAAATRRSPLALAVLALLGYKPLHPYGVQRLLKEWGKENVVNVGQRASLYKTMERLTAAGLIAVRETERDQQYPERTVYELTDAGREAAQAWIDDIVRVPRPEYPEFPAALSFLMMLGPDAVLAALRERHDAVAKTLAAAKQGLADAQGYGLPKVTLLDDEYLVAVTEAELRWIEGVVAELENGELTWSLETLAPFVEGDTEAPGGAEQG